MVPKKFAFLSKTWTFRSDTKLFVQKLETAVYTEPPLTNNSQCEKGVLSTSSMYSKHWWVVNKAPIWYFLMRTVWHSLFPCFTTQNIFYLLSQRQNELQFTCLKYIGITTQNHIVKWKAYLCIKMCTNATCLDPATAYRALFAICSCTVLFHGPELSHHNGAKFFSLFCSWMPSPFPRHVFHS